MAEKQGESPRKPPGIRVEKKIVRPDETKGQKPGAGAKPVPTVPPSKDPASGPPRPKKKN